jgi:hypothetical protein
MFAVLLTMQTMWWFMFSYSIFEYKTQYQIAWDLGVVQSQQYESGSKAVTEMWRLECNQFDPMNQQNDLDTLMFVQVGIASLLLIFSCRTKGPFFLSCPSPTILISVIFFIIVGIVFLALPFWNEIGCINVTQQYRANGTGDWQTCSDYTTIDGDVKPIQMCGNRLIVGLSRTGYDGYAAFGYTLLYNVCWLFVVDIAKMATYKVLHPEVYHSDETYTKCRCLNIEMCCKTDASEKEKESQEQEDDAATAAKLKSRNQSVILPPHFDAERIHEIGSSSLKYHTD